MNEFAGCHNPLKKFCLVIDCLSDLLKGQESQRILTSYEQDEVYNLSQLYFSQFFFFCVSLCNQARPKMNGWVSTSVLYKLSTPSCPQCLLPKDSPQCYNIRFEGKPNPNERVSRLSQARNLVKDRRIK